MAIKVVSVQYKWSSNKNIAAYVQQQISDGSISPYGLILVVKRKCILNYLHQLQYCSVSWVLPGRL